MKTLLILTGHTKGLGHAILDQFLSLEGIQVVALSRSSLEIAHSNLTEIALDLSDLNGLEANLPKFFPKVQVDRYILINNAGWIGEVKPVGKLNPKGIQRVMNLNLLAPMILTDAFVKAYGQQKGQKIICNISSGAAHKPLPGWGEYCSSKAGLAMFSKVANEELKSLGFRVFSLAPGIVDTEMQSEIRQADVQNFPALDRFVGYKRDGRLTLPEEVAAKIFYLISHPEHFEEVVQDVRDF
ncbi:SDR family NAD(P)-dependent oxidoreductase [Algoriphagus sp. AK58]|uniref:SDR family NAD(P)-dependent oxidoreductase n=1 Tax=Algoriphagus sp. AK58 TaxID=1406877 RepID=UPI0016508554|nr:SDR family NAD(P)-dependent oxidoreductase [Algoriphagus sp. AK58]MBC6368703.1 short-chain dehydrogenase [Algoriphagus sp. AK58]